MSGRPITFSAPMIRALLAGRKTQTRRILKGAPEGEGWHCDRGAVGLRWVANGGAPSIPVTGLPWQRGDRIWVREAWHPDPNGLDSDGTIDVHYPADSRRGIGLRPRGDWRLPKAASAGRVSPMFMPRWASRITLRITDVRVQRLTDISEGDAEAEGLVKVLPPSDAAGCWSWEGGPDFIGCWSANWAYGRLWDSIHGVGAWGKNPWVYALNFTVTPRNVDEDVRAAT